MPTREEIRQAAIEELRRRGISTPNDSEKVSSIKDSSDYRNSLRQAARAELARRGEPYPGEDEQNKTDVRWPRFLGENAAKGTLSTADLGQFIGTLGGNIGSEKRPISETTKEALIRDYGIDLDSQGEGNTPFQRIAGKAAQFVGGAFIPGAGFLKSIIPSAAIGAGSGALQEAGANPLVADLTAIGAGALAPGTISKIKNFGKPKLSPEELKVAENLQGFVGEKRLPSVSQNLLRKSGVPNYEPMTAELANNPSLSQIHRTRLGIPGSGLQEQASRQNEAIMSLIEQNSLKAPTSSEIIQDVGNELSKRKLARHAATQEGYDAVEKMTEKLTPSNLIKFLESKPASGKIRKDLNEIRKELNIPDKMSPIENEYKSIYENASPISRKKMEPPFSVSPEISKLATLDIALTAKIEGLKKSENARRKVLKLAQDELRKDLDAVDTYGKARSEYARLSKPVNEIDRHPILKKIPESSLNNIMPYLYSSRSADNMRQLRKVLGNDSKKWEGIQHATTEHLKNSILNSAAEGRSHVLSSPKMKEFMKAHGKALESVYTPEQMKVIKSIEEALKGQNIAKTLGEGPGSPTQSRQMIEKMLAKGLGMRALEFGTKAATFVPRHIFGLRGIGKAVQAPVLGALEYLAQNNEKKLKEVLDKALREPEFAHRLLTHNFKTPGDFNRFLDIALPRAPVLMRHNQRKD